MHVAARSGSCATPLAICAALSLNAALRASLKLEPGEQALAREADDVSLFFRGYAVQRQLQRRRGCAGRCKLKLGAPSGLGPYGAVEGLCHEERTLSLGFGHGAPPLSGFIGIECG
jgi:hypothetical protein